LSQPESAETRESWDRFMRRESYDGVPRAGNAPRERPHGVARCGRCRVKRALRLNDMVAGEARRPLESMFSGSGTRGDSARCRDAMGDFHQMWKHGLTWWGVGCIPHQMCERESELGITPAGASQARHGNASGASLSGDGPGRDAVMGKGNARRDGRHADIAAPDSRVSGEPRANAAR
jgi:hypothetical protein